MAPSDDPQKTHQVGGRWSEPCLGLVRRAQKVATHQDTFIEGTFGEDSQADLVAANGAYQEFASAEHFAAGAHKVTNAMPLGKFVVARSALPRAWAHVTLQNCRNPSCRHRLGLGDVNQRSGKSLGQGSPLLWVTVRLQQTKKGTQELQR